MANLFGGPDTGMDPAVMQQQLDSQRAAEASKLTPAQIYGQMAYQGGAGLTRGIGGLLGADTTDPTLKRASLRNSIASSINPEDIDSIKEGIANLQKAGFSEDAFALSSNLLEREHKRSVITKNEREKLAADPVQKIIQVGKYTTPSIEKYQQSGKISDLEPIDKADPTVLSETAEGIFLINKFTGKKIERIGSAPERGNKVNVSVDAKGETAFVQELGKLDAKKVTEAMSSRENAIKELSTLQKMAEVVQRPVISGSFAEQRSDVSNFFNTIGLASNSDKIKNSNSQEYIKYSTGLVLDNLKKTGYNPSNRDMQVVASIIPRLETDPVARKELITFMASKAKEVVDETTRLEQHARTNKGLTGYVPKVPLVSFGTSTGKYTGMSDAELAARIKRAQAAQPGF